MKKSLSVIIAVAMMLTMLSFSVSADTGIFSVSVQNTVSSAGQLAKVTFNVDNNPGMFAMQIELDYDKTVMELKGLKVGDVLKTMTPNVAGNKLLLESSEVTYDEYENAIESDSKLTGTLFTATFLINSDAANGDYSVGAHIFGAAANYNTEDVPTSFTPGKITVTSGTAGLFVEYNEENAGVIDVITQSAVTLSETAPEVSGKLFLGWYLSDGKTPVTNGMIVNAGEKISAKFIDLETDYDSPNANFYMQGAQIRIKDAEVKQGLRFVVHMDRSILRAVDAIAGSIKPESSSDTGIGFGTVVLPTVILGNEKLVKDGSYTYNGKEYKASTVPAVNLLKFSEDYIKYSVCMVDISVLNYTRYYSVVPYITSTDASGYEHTIYGKEYSASIFYIAEKAYASTTEPEYNQEYIYKYILNVVDPDKYPDVPGWTEIYK